MNKVYSLPGCDLIKTLVLGCWVGVVCAQQNIDDILDLSPAELAEITVTIASGTAKPISQSASVTSVITAEQITRMGATELHQVLETVPGMHVSIQPVTGDHIFTMRGIRNTLNSEVLIMLNGTRISIPYQGTLMANMIIPVQAIQRVEVIRGPGSALYGADAFAGVINIITKNAADLDGVTLGGRAGNVDTQSGWAQYGGQWQGWEVATSLQYSHNGIDHDRIVDADLQSQFDSVLGTHASLAPGPMQDQNQRWNGHLNVKRKHWDLGFWAFNEMNGGFHAGTGGSLDNRGQVDGSNYLADLRYSTEDLFQDWEWLAHVSYLHTDLDANIYNFPAGTVLPITAEGNINPAPPFNLVYFPDGVNSQLGFVNQVPSVELTSIYKGFQDHLLRVVASFRHEQISTTEARNYGIGVTPGVLTQLTGTPYTFLADQQRSVGSFVVQDEWQFAKNWSLTGGLRYDYYSDFGDTVNPRFALVWQTTEQLTSKILYGEAFRAPSFVEQYQRNNQLFVGNPSLMHETIHTTELAFDYRPMHSLRTGVNLYYYKIENLIGEAQSLGDNTLTATKLQRPRRLR